MKTVLLYTISANIPPWADMIQTARETWASSHTPGVTIRFYVGNPAPPPREDTVHIPIDESYATMGRKNLAAFRKALNWGWDFMARNNISTYVRKERLLEHVQTLPTTRLIQGVGAPYGDKSIYLWGGANFIMSRDVVQAFVNNESKWNHGVMEDVAISQLAVKLGFTLDTRGKACSVNKRDHDWLCIFYGGGKQGGFEFQDMREMRQADEHFFIRVKQDLKRHLDAVIMHALKDAGL